VVTRNRLVTIMNEVRESGIKALSTVLTVQQNIEIIERNIHEVTGDDVETYRRVLMQIVGDILSGHKPTTCLNVIKEGNVGWKHRTYDTATAVLEEQDDFIKHPFHVEEGVLQCKCGSRKVYSFSKQTRSADEPMTTYAECVSCNSKWTYSG
jgi:DNA-directed RNA polymerase subunit M/transcription elongation factor TFIIS